MSIRPDHFRQYVVRPTLSRLAELSGQPNINSEEAEELIMGTVAHESHLGHYLHQHPVGPARGVGQMEEFTYYDLWESYLKHRTKLADAARAFASIQSIENGIPDFSDVIGNLAFAVVMIRVRYLPAPQALPSADDLEAQANYHIKYYNRGGAAEVHKYVNDYRRYVLGES
ncbi:MAG: hypothetical protein R3332_00385 [Pseudohongiellaceae bacterium]|nr:hypothetical protein [Pseudohongiellaceae bacterium]